MPLTVFVGLATLVKSELDGFQSGRHTKYWYNNSRHCVLFSMNFCSFELHLSKCQFNFESWINSVGIDF